MRKVRVATFLALIAVPICRLANTVAAQDPVAPASVSSPALSMPNALIERIARATQPKAGTNLSRRESEVRQWLRSVNGDDYFKSYQEKFDAPADPVKRYSAATKNVTSSQLGLYYIHQPAASGKTLTAYPCDPPNAKSSTTIRGLCALANWNAYVLTHDIQYRNAFLEGARWFLANNNDGRWLRTEDVPSRQLHGAWISGLSQSLGISILLRAYQATSNATYLEVAKQAYGWISRPIAAGGVTSPTEGGTWIEEYPNANASHVLNGHIWGLFGVLDYYRVTKDPAALRLFKSGIAAIKHSLRWYDTGYWVVYDHQNRTDFVTGMYMQFIVQQFYALYAITADPLFRTTADKWMSYQTSDALFVHLAATEFMRAQHRLKATD